MRRTAPDAVFCSFRLTRQVSKTKEQSCDVYRPLPSYHFLLGGVRRRLCTGCSIPLRLRHSMSQGFDRSWVEAIRSILVDGRRVVTRSTLSSAHSCCCYVKTHDQAGAIWETTRHDMTRERGTGVDQLAVGRVRNRCANPFSLFLPHSCSSTGQVLVLHAPFCANFSAVVPLPAQTASGP